MTPRAPRTTWLFLPLFVLALAGCGDEGLAAPDLGQRADLGGQPDLSVLTACPATAQLDGPCSGSFSCTYGTETCCGMTYPSLVCQCRQGRLFCAYTDACLIPPGACGDGGI